MAPLRHDPANRVAPHVPSTAHADEDVVAPPKPRLPPAAARTNLFVLTLLSAVDGSLIALAAAGYLDSPAEAIAIGLVVVAGVGSWLAAHQAFAGRPRGRADWSVLAILGVATLASTVAAVWLGQAIGAALTLHVLPKGAGLVLFLVSAEVAGLRLPRVGRVPLPALGLGAAAFVEVLVQWTA